MKNLKLNYINESGLGKILAIGGGLTGAAIAGNDFINDLHHNTHTDLIANPNAYENNMLKALKDGAKVPLYGLSGAAVGGIAGGLIGSGSAQRRPMNQFRRR